MTCMEFETLQKIIAEVLDVEEDEITMDTRLLEDLGADSLDAVDTSSNTASPKNSRRSLSCLFPA